MENSKENPHPEIETVTPDTDDGQPNDQKHNHRVKNEATDDAEEKPSVADVESEEKESSEEQSPETEEPVEDTETESKEQPDDEANPSDIETVSP